ncbi:MAG: hypothetical protein LQ340_001987 [Diploschistes diacapsis]|nr:MAG: hypothetical protein LQ340_001987 [Diploschistes diacapsis]
MKGSVSTTGGHAPATSTGEKTWSPKEIINILERKNFSDRDPVLRIDVSAIKDRFAKYRDVKADDEPPQKSIKVSPVDATCSLTIWDSTSGTFDTVVEQTRRCEIFQKNKASGERYASIELAEPFIVTLQKLQPKRDLASQTYGEQLFSMQLAIMAANSTDRWPPVDTKVPPPKTTEFRDPTGHLVRFPVLVAKWLRLPRVPANEDESSLELFASQDQTKYKPKLSLKISAQWMQAPSPLAAYNSECRGGLISPDTSSRSTSTHDRSEPKTVIKTAWVFEQLADFMDKLPFDGYACAMCEGKQFLDVHEFHFHLVNGHDLFKFAFSQDFKTNSLGQSIAEGLVRVDFADGYDKRPIGKNSLDPREMAWLRPYWPFDINKYLKGDESWLGRSTVRKHGLLVPPPRLERSSSRDVVKDVPPTTIARPPDQIPDLVPSVRKKFRVPAAPHGMSFYRTTAKCPLNEGDEVSESDDNIDEEWLLKKHSDTIDSFTDTLPQEKEFMQVYDKHMLQEDVSSDLHAGEALVRFCRANKAWLQTPPMRLELSKKAAALKLQGALTSTIIRACLAIVNSPTRTSPDNEDAMDIDTSPPSASRKTHPANKSTPNGQKNKPPETFRPLTPPEIGHIYGRCAKCNSAILDMHSNIRCANPMCLRADHHLLCVGLSRRDVNWICEKCGNAGFVLEGKTKPAKSGVPSIEAARSTATPPVTAANAPVSPPVSTPASTSVSTSAAATAPVTGAATGMESGSGSASKLAIRSQDSSPARISGAKRSGQSKDAVEEGALNVSLGYDGADESGDKVATTYVLDRKLQHDNENSAAGADLQDSQDAANTISAISWLKATTQDLQNSEMHNSPSPSSSSESDEEEEDEEGDSSIASEAHDASDEDYKESEHGDKEYDGDVGMDD